MDTTTDSDQFRLIGWDPFKPASIRFLSSNGCTPTRHAEQAHIVTGYIAADRMAIQAASVELCGFAHWRAVSINEPDLQALQGHERVGREPVGPTPGSALPSRNRTGQTRMHRRG